ncbi:hypothetical protein J4Q44_G00012270 [Coregonus suidteri]|uniref:Monocarboxylate transporter 6 n=1 Tax=Coregonus suidteri TaxID=861788 RepID=A0AAN8MHC4_9TELE
MMLGFVVPLIYLVPYATAHDMEQSRAALLLSILGIVNIVVRPPIGLLFSLPWFKGRHIYVFSAALLMNGLSNSICCIDASFSVLLVYVVTYGLSMSVVGSLMFTVLMDTLDMSRFPAALGLLAIMESVTLLIGPPLAGIMVDRTGEYFYVFFACSATVASSAVFLMVSFYWLDRRVLKGQQVPPQVSPPKPASVNNVVSQCQYTAVCPQRGTKTRPQTLRRGMPPACEQRHCPNTYTKLTDVYFPRFCDCISCAADLKVQVYDTVIGDQMQYFFTHAIIHKLVPFPHTLLHIHQCHVQEDMPP